MAWDSPGTYSADDLVKADEGVDGAGDPLYLNQTHRDNFNHLVTPLDETTEGDIRALDSTAVADLSGANLTGVAFSAAVSTYTAGNQNFNGGANVRFLLPVGTDLWAT